MGGRDEEAAPKGETPLELVVAVTHHGNGCEEVSRADFDNADVIPIFDNISVNCAYSFPPSPLCSSVDTYFCIIVTNSAASFNNVSASPSNASILSGRLLSDGK